MRSQPRAHPAARLGCTSDTVGSPTAKWAPGPGPQQWAYRGSSLGPPDEPVNDEGCEYKLSYENLKMGYECYRLPPLGGVRTDVANEPNLLYSVSGRRFPPRSTATGSSRTIRNGTTPRR